MIRVRLGPLVALSWALSCATPRAPQVVSAPVEPPRFEGRVVHPLPHDALRLAYFEAAVAQRRDAAPSLPPDAGASTLREGFSPWLRRRADGLRALAEQIPALDARSPDDRVFASVIYATVADELHDAVRALPAPPGLDADAVTLWRETRNAQVRPLARHARAAWSRCRAAIDEASPLLGAWRERCAARVAELDAVLAVAPPPQRPRPQRIELPADCDGPELRDPPRDPDAPPPNERSPREVALLYDDARFQGAERARLLGAVRARLARTPGLRLIPQAEIDTATFLRTQRRWRRGGPVCGQPPPLPALLAVRHPNLVLATIDTWCGEVEPEGDAGRSELCTLSVGFARAGTTDRTNLPQMLAVDVQGPAGELESWVRAAQSLGDPDAGTSMSGILGALGHGGGPVVRVLGYAEVDPWLRVGRTLTDGAPYGVRSALEACVSRFGGVGVYRLGWTISPEGIAQDVSVQVSTEPRDQGGARVSACVQSAIARAGFPCPRAGAAVQVSARLCLGWH